MTRDDIYYFLLKAVISTPFIIGAVLLFIKGGKRYSEFLYREYQGDSQQRFKENFVSSLYMSLGTICLALAILGFRVGSDDIRVLLCMVPVILCMGAFILPFGVLQAYWRSYQINKLWGGFLPTVRTYYGYDQSELTLQKNIDPSKVKLPRRVTISAAATALLLFLAMLYLLSKVEWNGPVCAGILILFLFSGLMAFGVFMTIVSTSLARRIQKLRDGEPLDDDGT